MDRSAVSVENYMSNTTLVIPCYNEASRLDVKAFTRFAQSRSDVTLILVNDGSRDDTLRVLNEIAQAAPATIHVLDLEKNSGKAEAVRRGMLRAIEMRPDFAGFWDADLATPLAALPAFIDILDAMPALDGVIGSRVRLLGRDIDRRAARHYSGRVFATAASLTLQVPVYDTQCGAKLFRVGPRLSRVLATPFLSRWIFDVEMLARLGAEASGYAASRIEQGIYEYPLSQWQDVKGSKLSTWDFVRSAFDLLRIRRAYIRPAKATARTGEGRPDARDIPASTDPRG